MAPKGAKRRWRSRWWLWRKRRSIFDAVGRLGYLSTNHIREVVNQILWDQFMFLKVEAGDFTPPPERIRFADLNPVRISPTFDR